MFGLLPIRFCTKLALLDYGCIMPQGRYKHTEEHIGKLLEFLKPYCFDKGHIPWNKGKKGIMPPAWNKGLSAATNPKVSFACSKGLLKYAQSPEGREKSREGLRKRSSEFWANATAEERQDFIDKRTERIRETRGLPEACEKQRASLKETHEAHPEWAEKSSKLSKQRFQNPEYYQKMLKVLDRGRENGWADPEKKERRIKAMWKASARRPTGTEQVLINVITEYNLPYKYVGTGEFLLDGKNPDFMNINGQKKLIEVFGEFWHKKEDEQIRKDFFRQYGFDTLVLWHKDIMSKSKEELAGIVRAF